MAPLVAIGIPTLGTVRSEWVQALRGMSMPLGAASGDIWVPGPGTVAEKRNAIAKNALEQNCRYVFFLGDDTLPPQGALMQLLQTAINGDKKVVTGVYTSRASPPQPFIWRGWMEGSYYDWHVGEVFEVDWAGCDLLLVNTDVFRAIEPPWFSEDYLFGPNQKKPSNANTEDVFFYQKVKGAGFKVWCDASVIAIHQDRNTGAAYSIPDGWPQWTPGSVIPEVEDGYLIADFGAGRDSWFPPVGSRLVRYDIDETVKPDVRCDIRRIPEPDQKFDEIWSRHVLEHFPMGQTPALVREWCRTLKVGGNLRFNVPNFQLAVENILAGPPKVTEYNWWQVYGRQEDEYDFHKNGFTQRNLQKLLELAWGEDPVHGVDAEGNIKTGQVLGEIKVEVVGNSNENLDVTAVKLLHPTPTVLGPEGEFAPAAASPQAEASHPSAVEEVRTPVDETGAATGPNSEPDMGLVIGEMAEPEDEKPHEVLGE